MKRRHGRGGGRVSPTPLAAESKGAQGGDGGGRGGGGRGGGGDDDDGYYDDDGDDDDDDEDSPNTGVRIAAAVAGRESVIPQPHTPAARRPSTEGPPPPPPPGLRPGVRVPAGSRVPTGAQYASLLSFRDREAYLSYLFDPENLCLDPESVRAVQRAARRRHHASTLLGGGGDQDGGDDAAAGGGQGLAASGKGLNASSGRSHASSSQRSQRAQRTRRFGKSHKQVAARSARAGTSGLGGGGDSRPGSGRPVVEPEIKALEGIDKHRVLLLESNLLPDAALRYQRPPLLSGGSRGAGGAAAAGGGRGGGGGMDGGGLRVSSGQQRVDANASMFEDNRGHAFIGVSEHKMFDIMEWMQQEDAAAMEPRLRENQRRRALSRRTGSFRWLGGLGGYDDDDEEEEDPLVAVSLDDLCLGPQARGWIRRIAFSRPGARRRPKKSSRRKIRKAANLAEAGLA